MCLDHTDFWDVWTDICCNYGHLLMDRRGMCLNHTEFLEHVDRCNGHLLTDRRGVCLTESFWDVDRRNRHLLMDSLKRSITPAGHRAEARGGTRIIPTPSFIQHSLLNAAIWLESNQQPLNHYPVLLPLSHRSHV
ncbi:hypothetical protein QQF64_035301 [Cirrhinus molitorella]|uniref:Uncharacterized protein n=1 Tax=Cirrhinus molitorella TaxID=172907 RepID=A0ABR3NG28_9TELE